MYVCECGCWDVEGTEWVHLNTGRLVGSEPPSEDYWCPACEEHQERVAILEADGTNAEDKYTPFKLVGAEPKPVASTNEQLLLDAVRFCLAVADDQLEPADAVRRIQARLKKAMAAIDAP